MRSQRIRNAAIAAFLTSTLGASAAHAAGFPPGTLILSRSQYQGTASTVVVGQALPGAVSPDAGVPAPTAVADGTLPNVWNNEVPDPSFGVTSPIFLDDLSPTGVTLGTVPVPPAQMVTSFSSKSELGLNLSTDSKFVTFIGYVATVNTLDVSNSNTPNHNDPTNPVALSFQRAVGQVDLQGNFQVTPVNTYSGNNGRAAIYDATNNQYILVGNAGNGGSPEPVGIVNNTGVQLAPIGSAALPETTVVGVQQGVAGAANGFQFGYSVVQNGFAADKSGKDDNFRGLAIFGNTLYVTKGSGSNGVNTVYQVGTAGTLPTTTDASTTAISILPGFPATLARSAGAIFPFAIWFANATTLYMADEGDGKVADAATDVNAGLQKWVLQSGTWTNVYTLQNGLNLGTQYSVSGLPSSLNPATDGLRTLSGNVNTDGTVTLYAVTSTVSASGDQGADSNRLVTITDNLSFMTAAAASGESFTTLQTAPFGQVFRGVQRVPGTFTPPPVPAIPRGGTACLGLALLALGAAAIRVKKHGFPTIA
jgi:hypothetical protein